MSRSNRGKWAEARVEQCASLMATLGIAKITKAATPVRVTRRAGRIAGAHFCGRAPIDYSGTLASGAAVHVEVKSTKERTLSLKRRVSATQRAALDEALRWTPHVYVLAVFAGPPFRWFLLPWRECRGWERVDPAVAAAHEAGDLFLSGAQGAVGCGSVGLALDSDTYTAAR